MCHNICVVIQSMYVLNIEPTFGQNHELPKNTSLDELFGKAMASNITVA